MNRRKQHIQEFKPNFHERRKRWVDRRHRSRLLGIILVPYVRLKTWLSAKLGIGYENH